MYYSGYQVKGSRLCLLVQGAHAFSNHSRAEEEAIARTDQLVNNEKELLRCANPEARVRHETKVSQRGV